MKFIIPAIFAILFATVAPAEETNPIYRTPDAESKFKEAQLRVRELMKAGQYEEAAKFMPVYQTLACEAAEQKAGTSAEQGAAICAGKNNQAGISTGVLKQQPAHSAAESPLVPGVTVLQPTIPGSSTLLDGSAPSIFVFDPRTAPAPRTDSRGDPWTGNP
ncbi:hypothetical protein SAMN05216420_102229 [Nitrosospira sp. Nl5]|uniref:hypothetical protein n=1 Tax=Nitrosospira sp. Nl5 TaxID=200120 RepID=UPI00088B653E|nr:hypothetical protein [Nitrosospira sp. Nl5]SCY08224.1 hypothetical protein SAMN05216420_102229 [Nitrosospira sp. Nl5]